MATVSMTLWAGARAAAGVDRFEVEARSVDEALAVGVERHPGLGRVLPVCSLLLDGRTVHDRDRQRPLTGRVEVDVLPPFAGG